MDHDVGRLRGFYVPVNVSYQLFTLVSLLIQKMGDAGMVDLHAYIIVVDGFPVLGKIADNISIEMANSNPDEFIHQHNTKTNNYET